MDAEFILDTQPNSFKAIPKNDEFFVKLGNGYLAILHVYDFPIRPNFFWIEQLISQGVEVTIGYKKADQLSALKSIGKSINELETQPQFDTSGTALQNAANQIDDLTNIFQLVDRGGESIADVFITLQLTDLNPYNLLDRVNKIKTNLQISQFETTFKLFENTMMLDFVMGRNTEKSLSNYGKQMPLSTLVKGLSFRQQSFVDTTKFADFLGYSHSGGIVMLDTWLKTASRLSFDKFFVGKKGSGKSTAMKIDIINNFKKKIRQFILDAEKEYGKLTEYLGGRMIDVSTAKINLLQMFHDWVTHLSMLTEILQMLFPSESSASIDFLKQTIVQYYHSRGITKDTDFLSLENEDFPTFNEIRIALRQTLYDTFHGDINRNIVNPNIHPSQIQLYFDAERMLNKFCDEEYMIFDGYTTFNITDDNLVCFDISAIINFNSELRQTLYFTLTNFIWKEVEKNRSEKQKLSGKIKRIAIYLDECHHLLKSNNLFILNFIENLLRRGRKYLAGMIFASQRLQDFIPSGEGEVVDAIKTIFALVEYKFIMQVDEMDMQLIEEFLPKITEVEQNIIRDFEYEGECLLSVSNINLPFRFLLPPVYEDLIDGQLIA